jgi:hypothetical protein
MATGTSCQIREPFLENIILAFTFFNVNLCALRNQQIGLG